MELLSRMPFTAVLLLGGCSCGLFGGYRVTPGAPACDPAVQPLDGVFVSDASGSDTGGGTTLSPFKTIGVAINLAIASSRSVVYLDEGTYNEAVTLPDTPTGLYLEGGWVATGATWARDCAAGAIGRTVIAAPATASVAVTADGVRHASGLRSLTVTTKARGESLADGSGESLTGVLVRGDASVFSLTDVAVVAGGGGNGGVASAGIAGAAGATPGTCGACATGANGTAAAMIGLPAATSGTFAMSGYGPVDGSGGFAGSAGENGTAGGAATTVTCVTACDLPCGCSSRSGTQTSGTGLCGCGGGGGAGGFAGRGGGASVALLVIGAGATVSVERGRLEAGGGGNGSDGALGGVGGPGSVGAGGAGTRCCTSCNDGGSCGDPMVADSCYLGSCSTVNGGAAGGLGGAGGPGSPGGAGSGGPSFAVVRVGGALVVLSGSPQTVFGAPGQGAGSGAAMAPGGAAGPDLAVP